MVFGFWSIGEACTVKHPAMKSPLDLLGLWHGGFKAYFVSMAAWLDHTPIPVFAEMSSY